MSTRRTRVVIIGAGPSGLLLGQLLHKAGIDNVILERQSAQYVLGRIRAGVLEQTTVALLEQAGVATRLHAEGRVHDGVGLAFDDRLHRIDLRALTGHGVTVYGQTEVTRDLMGARAAAGCLTVYEAAHVSLHDFDGERPFVRYSHEGGEHELHGDFIAGCDGFHGVSRVSVPARALRTFERVFPIGWLGVLAQVPPCNPELVYASHERGFALCSQRTPRLSRYYIQVSAGAQLGQWSDADVWDELRRRLPGDVADAVSTGPAVEKSITPLRSFVAEPMRFGHLLLAGDAAHIVPPTGAKGLNLAASDVGYLATALREYFDERSSAALNAYSSRCLQRVWGAVRFSCWLSALLHRLPDATPFDRSVQSAELDHIVRSRAASTALAESYVGMPL